MVFFNFEKTAYIELVQTERVAFFNVDDGILVLDKTA